MIILVNGKVALQNGFDVSALAGSFSTNAKEQGKKKRHFISADSLWVDGFNFLCFE